MRILFVYPEYPRTYWSFHYALKFISKKASIPPLGLLTVSALLPGGWKRKLVDMNVQPLRDKDIKWADLVMISAMDVQRESAVKVISRCRALGVKTAAGGPLFTCNREDFPEVDYLILDEGEITLPDFVRDFTEGFPKKLYTSTSKADLTRSPIPDWGLINMKKYASLNLQYSRGCPFNCDFCSITSLLGRIPRTKEKSQVLSELDEIYNRGWRGAVFFVDDNFIGNKVKLKREILPAIIEWMVDRKYPFQFYTEASVDLSDDERLMSLMVEAGFNTVFIGIETPNEESLAECSKMQNKNRDLISTVKKMHSFGLQVQGGFIVGFDNDPATIFERLISFIQESGITTAMVGLLNAPRGTRLYGRLLKEGRITGSFSGNNTDMTLNFKPKMDYDFLMQGYRKIVDTIYSPVYYYERVVKFLREYRPVAKGMFRIKLCDIRAFLKSIFVLGIFAKERCYYWKLLLWSLLKRREVFPLAVSLSIYGFHFRKVFEKS